MAKPKIKFSDGTEIDGSLSFDRLLRLVSEKMRSNGASPTEIVTDDDVTLKVNGLAVNPEIAPAQPTKSVMTDEFRDWKIQVWREPTDPPRFACNYYRGETVRYFEVFVHDANDDENEVFKIAKGCIRDQD